MALPQSIIHCLADQEPTSFHQSDIDGATVSFAVNLSFEYESEAADEASAKSRFQKFLQCVQRVQFRVFSLSATDATLTAVGLVDNTISARPYAVADNLFNWLQGFEASAGGLYWSTIVVPTAGKTTAEIAVNAESASAAHRLRAVQSWNAPVGHKFALTHIVRIAQTTIEAAGKRFVIIPYFDDPPAGTKPDFILSVPPLSPAPPQPDEVALDYAYNPQGGFGDAVCRTNWIGDKITKIPFQLPLEVDDGISETGYFIVDPDAESVRRLLGWIEERAASLMTANSGLFPLGHNKADEEFEQLFKIAINVVPKDAPTWDNKGAATWYVAARLTSALDNFVIALLKPTAASAGARTTAGDVLAPLVSALLQRLGDALDSSQLTVAIRKVLTDNSPLMSKAPTETALVGALRHVYGLSAPPKVIDERTLVTALLEDFQHPNQQIDPQSIPFLKSIDGHSAQSVSRALLELEQVLYDEAGAEAAIIRIVETVETGTDRFAVLLAKEIAKGTQVAAADIQGAVDAAWSDYRALLDSPFNGAEAIRRAASSTFILELLNFKGGHVPPKRKKPWTTLEFLRWIVRASAFYERRFFAAPKKLKGIAEALFKPDVTKLPVATRSALRVRLRQAFYAAILPMEELTGARFIPDRGPQPIPVQIAANIDGSKLDNFGKHLNGVAMAIERADEGTSPPDKWAYANLADLGWTGDFDLPGTDVKGAIHPMLPAASDGRNPMFVEYQGFPFADRALDARIVQNDAQDPATIQHPFYRQDPHTADDFTAVPRIAYGRNFKTFSFVTSNAGALPLALQLGSAAPWMPKLEPAPPGTDDVHASPLLVGTAQYQRRTAIAQMPLIETPVPHRSLRLGASIAGVKPLAEDYPRVGLLAGPVESAVRDIMREADGAGQMVASQNFEWGLSDIEFGGKPDKLILRFFERPASDPTDRGDAWFTIDESSAPGFARLSEIKIGIEFRQKNKKGLCERRLYVRCGVTIIDPDKVDPPKAFPPGNSVAGWLRLELQSVDGKRASFAFAKLGSQKSDNVNDPLLLLALNETDWAAGLAKPVEITVSTPRVGYLDFDRWFANADLRNEMFFPPDKPKNTASIRLFEQMLVTAYVMRHLDPGLAAALDRLPDPAVDQIRIELTPHDVLTGIMPELDSIAPRLHPVGAILQEFARQFSDRVDQMLANDFHWKPSQPRPDPIPWSPRRLRTYVFEPLDQRFQFKITLRPGTALSLGSDTAPFTADVPEGVVARLSLDSLVPDKHFKDASPHPSVFHPDMRQYAQRSLTTGYLTFPAAAVRIETMYDGIKEIAAIDKTKDNQIAIALAASMIVMQGVEKNRKYDIMTGTPTNGTDRRHWRLLQEIDVTTQRWRTTGRPIYHYVNPRPFRFGGASKDAEPLPCPALRLDLDLDGKGELAQFELEAFFDRPDIDAQTVTKTLDPLPARTTLQEIYWNPESATYFRHRFRLRSRYANALKLRNRGEVVTWWDKTPKTPAHAWSMRVAVLADLANVKMTRPQLRALIPLTTAPGGDELARPAPPVAAILQEPPFARGGLADRIAFEVKTGFSYGFTYFESEHPSDKDHHLEIIDSRKEAGPDPRVDYRPLGREAAFGLVLRSEGPMGLTFDNIDGPAPAYQNAMFSLLPATLNGGTAVEQWFEEMFIGAAMRRYIDPNWTTGASRDALGLDGERCWWIVPKQPGSPPEKLLSYLLPGNDRPFSLLVLAQNDKCVEVKTSRLAVDGVGASVTNEEGDLVTILKFEKSRLLSLAILHQPVAPGRYSTSVFVTDNSANTERGEINAPLMLASFEWSPPVEDADGRPKPTSVTISADKMSAYATLASAPTFVRWTRTGRDFDFLHLPAVETDDKGTESWKVQRRHVRELVAALDPKDGHLSFSLNGVEEAAWLCPSTFDNPFPIHVHRHLGVITSYFLKELGRPAELFAQTALVRDKKVILVAPDGSTIDTGKKLPRDHAIRVVEFETPAQILCDRNVNVSLKYKEAYFDLLSTGFDGENPTRIHLYFRIVGPPSHQRLLSGLRVNLRPAVFGDKIAPKPIALKWTNQPQSFVLGIHLTLQQKGKASENLPTAVEARLLRSDGSMDVVTDSLPAPVRITDRGLFASIETTMPAGHECWTDVSLLHSTGEIASAGLDFDWLFSPAGDEEPAVSVAPASLNMMREAQARVVAVSLPIPVARLGG
ncbi:hypothetical protein JIR23_05525 [Bradyrhizobium diazoefficiens]|nr:hypothetical protein [Bradyrhizobium diazoefficiens]QQN65260.1 hypothetical protein JIR23_05525 [Bradyrhizobium diazoefficiens]